MRVLLVTNMFPSVERPGDGVFVAREACAVQELGGAELSLSVLHVNTVSSRMRYLSGPFSVGRAIRRVRPDIVHVHYGLTQLLCVSWRGPCVVTFHGSDLTLPWQRAISNVLLRKGKSIPVVVSRALVDWLPRRLRASARIIGCGVDAAFMSNQGPRPARPRIPDVDHQRLVVGFPSSPLRPGKDYALFTEVLRELRGRGVNVREVILDGIAPERMPELVGSLDVLVMTSRHEGSPVITREAMCEGVRVVSVEVGDVRDQVAGLNGCGVVDTRDPAVLADAVLDVMTVEGPDPAAAAARFGIRIQAEAILRLYRDILEVNE